MEWKSNLITGLQWSDRIINREGKERIARELAAQVKDGEVIGAGSGSTVYLTLFAIAERIRTEKLQVSHSGIDGDLHDLCATGHSANNSLGEASRLDIRRCR